MIARMISSLIEANLWHDPLSQFAKASGLTVSLYGPDQRPVLQHLCGQSFTHLLDRAGFFEGGPGEEFERELVSRAFATGQQTEGKFREILPVFAFPLKESDSVLGVVVAGWAFQSFPNPVECARLALALNIPENSLWLAARENAPVGGEKLTAFLSLLKTWNVAIISQLISVKEANEVNRLKDQFLAIASHELRTPLTSILLRTEVLRRQDSLPEKARQSIQSIERSAVIQSRLVDDLLETSRLLTGKLKLDQHDFDPGELALEAYETCLPSAELKKVALRFNSAQPRRRYVGDGTRIQQVFWNLVNNAIKFTPAGGSVEIRTSEEAGGFVFEVRDTGKGLSPEEVKLLFQPFYQASANKHVMNAGLGLGLSIAKAIMEMHSGSIAVSSGGHGLGCVFHVVLPAAESAALPA